MREWISQVWGAVLGRNGARVNAAGDLSRRLSELTSAEAMLMGFGGAARDWGPVVTEQSAMAVSAVYRCVTLLSGMLATMPLKVYQTRPDGSFEEAARDRVGRLLARTPHPRSPLTAYQWREMWGHHFLLEGNHFSAIRYDGAGRITGFEPIVDPRAVEVLRRDSGGLAYRFHWPDARGVELLDQSDVIHIAGPGFNGYRAPSRIQWAARDAVALGMIMQDSTGVAHENGAVLSGMITLPPNVTRADKDRIEAYYRARATGRSNRGGLLFVDKDTTFTPMQMTPEDLNLIASRRFQIEDIARFFGVPPHMIGESAAATSWGSGIETLTLGFMRFTLDPELGRIEAEMTAKVCSEGSGMFVAFDRDHMLQADSKTSAEVAGTRINTGQITINEARRKMRLPPVEGGDVLMVNSTMRPLAEALQGKGTNAPP